MGSGQSGSFGSRWYLHNFTGLLTYWNFPGLFFVCICPCNRWQSRGRGILLYKGYTGMCRSIGCGFRPRFINRVWVFLLDIVIDKSKWVPVTVRCQQFFPRHVLQDHLSSKLAPDQTDWELNAQINTYPVWEMHNVFQTHPNSNLVWTPLPTKTNAILLLHFSAWRLC